MKIHHLILPLIACCVFAGCDRGTSSSTSDAEWDAQQKRYKQQVDDYDRQTKAADTNLAVIARQNERVDAAQIKMDAQVQRFEKLLDKWEEQSRRQDAILDAMEKQHGIKK